MNGHHRCRSTVPARPRTVPLLAVVLAATLPIGCVSRQAGAPRPPANTAIRELNLLAMPFAVNLDRLPGADGVAVKIFAIQGTAAKATPIRQGTLEITAYDGTIESMPPPEPFHVWRFDPAQLKPHAFQTVLGTGYNLILDWSPKTLTGSRVTVIGRYHPPAGEPVASAPSFVAATTL